MSTTSTTDRDQEGIFKSFYTQVCQRLDVVKAEISKKMKGKDVTLDLRVDDIRQCDLDLNGKPIIVNELFFDPPSFFHIVFSVSVSAKNYPDALEAYGYTARIFKDDRSVDLNGYNWHNNPLEKVFFLPVVSEATLQKDVNIEKNPTFKLYYEVRLGLNSRNSSTFVRTKEAATVTGKVMK